jgi:hypothetical protein
MSLKSFRPSQVNLEKVSFHPSPKTERMQLIETKYDGTTFILRLDDIVHTGIKPTLLYGTTDPNPKRFRLGLTLEDEQFFKNLQEEAMEYVQENRKALGLKKFSDEQLEELFQPFSIKKEGRSAIHFTTVFKDDPTLQQASGCHCALKIQGIVITNSSIKWSTSLQQIKLKERVDLLD